MLVITHEISGEEVVRSINSRKNKVVLNELADVKDWKKLIKSKTNVLICFGNGKASFYNSILGTLHEAAEIVRGLGTIATCDCSKSG
jgi:protein disulfide isomerase family A protein 5